MLLYCARHRRRKQIMRYSCDNKSRDRTCKCIPKCRKPMIITRAIIIIIKQFFYFPFVFRHNCYRKDEIGISVTRFDNWTIELIKKKKKKRSWVFDIQSVGKRKIQIYFDTYFVYQRHSTIGCGLSMRHGNDRNYLFLQSLQVVLLLRKHFYRFARERKKKFTFSNKFVLG